MVSRLPVGSPVPGQKTSSNFGRRSDPFLHRAAMHSGLDFRARRGHPVHATGAGKVIKAGYNGGYGRMVEISHGNGLTTRYAHMSRILVKVGQKISVGKIVGKVGSTGRSTGPHLHYEVRHQGRAQNPARYVRAGAKLKSLL
jgi:murein DD-endopeptidase MepM/ murein hydrolase activator NlpD